MAKNLGRTNNRRAAHPASNASDIDVINNDVEVSPISYLGASGFVIGFLVEKGHLKVRRDGNGAPHFMKCDMDDFLLKVRARSAELAAARSKAAS